MLQLHPNLRSDGKQHAVSKVIIGVHGEKIDPNTFSGWTYQAEIQLDDCIVSTPAPAPLAAMVISETKFFVDDDDICDDGSLEIQVRLFLRPPSFTRNVFQNIDTLNQLSEDMRLTLESDAFKDVKFVVGNKEISAHKVILSSRNEVFKKMFESQMKEAKNNIIVVSDIDFDTFKELLGFIYTGKVSENFSVLALELLSAAHLYQIEDLKKMCVNEISKNLTEDNAAGILRYAKLYDCDESLKTDAFELYKK
jgi:BTB/POZ domain